VLLLRLKSSLGWHKLSLRHIELVRMRVSAGPANRCENVHPQKYSRL
jgi:hypothetical protein